MERESLFRGKRKDNGQWSVGNLVISDDGIYDIVTGVTENPGNNGSYVWDEVIPETVGQFTGLCDKNGKKIFEGDIVKISVDYVDESEFSIQEVRWGKEGGYFCDEEFGFDFIPLLGNDDLELEIIGNIYESSHLLKDRNV